MKDRFNLEIATGEKAGRKILVDKEGSYHEPNKYCFSDTGLNASGEDRDAQVEGTDRAGSWAQSLESHHCPLLTDGPHKAQRPLPRLQGAHRHAQTLVTRVGELRAGLRLGTALRLSGTSRT